MLFEVELGVMISKRASRIAPSEYLDYIGGYFLLLDWTTEALISEGLKSSIPWWKYKAPDDFLAISDFLSVD